MLVNFSVAFLQPAFCFSLDQFVRQMRETNIKWRGQRVVSSFSS